jgi:hypothetical protein
MMKKNLLLVLIFGMMGTFGKISVSYAQDQLPQVEDVAGVVTSFSGDAKWVGANIPVFKQPSKHLTEAEQAFCTQKLLDQVNAQFKSNFTEEDVGPIQLLGWENPEKGFIHGGGFNIRILADLPLELQKHGKRIHPGRFATVKDMLVLGVTPSLHLPDKVENYETFNEYKFNDQVQVDFVAHLDTGYADEPGGVLVHFFRDVMGAHGRNPCPGRD